MFNLNECIIDEKKEKKVLCISCALIVVAMYLLSCSTSPLYPEAYYHDSGLFMVIGKGMGNGKIVYQDLFDHKGPILFFIEALGYSLGARSGVIFVQCIFAVVNFLFCYGIWKKIREIKNNKSLLDFIFIFVAAYSVFSYVFFRGNLSEEYSLPFISGSLYLGIKYALNTNKKEKHPPLYAFVYGICFTCLALIRLTNAVTIAGIVFAICVYLIYKKKFANLFLNMLTFILGCAVVAVPIVIYFYMNSALHDMIYATFTYNFKYTAKNASKPVLSNIPKYVTLFFPIGISAFFVLKNYKKNKEKTFLDFFVAVIFIVNAVFLIYFNNGTRYFTLFVPIYLLVLITYWTYEKKKIKNFIIILCTVIHLLWTGAYTASTILKLDDFKKQQEVSVKQSMVIPENERDSVIAFNVEPKYYLYMDIIPCHRYFMSQEWWASFDEVVNEEFMTFLKNDKPLWIVTNKREDNSELMDIIENNYTKKSESEYLFFYRINE